MWTLSSSLAWAKLSHLICGVQHHTATASHRNPVKHSITGEVALGKKHARRVHCYFVRLAVFASVDAVDDETLVFARLAVVDLDQAVADHAAMALVHFGEIKRVA